ncbi:MAG: 2'-5' RNA ligase family protein [Ignavibacteriales bacterium]|nr:2'-5' RNA ligase family protein [Ignavibacteriales bacterium]
MSLLVLAYPHLEKKDYDWIQSFRSNYDERYYNLVEPHFTLVFPTLDIPEKQFISHIAKTAKKFKEFYFVLRCAQIVKDSFSDYTDLFLIPEEGYRIFVKFHDALYTGILEKELRLDIAFIPHIGIANNVDAGKCKKLADEINATNPEIFGSINKLHVISFDNSRIKTLKEIIL